MSVDECGVMLAASAKEAVVAPVVAEAAPVAVVAAADTSAQFNTAMETNVADEAGLDGGNGDVVLATEADPVAFAIQSMKQVG